MKNVFRLSHPLGSVIGKAKYGDYFVAMQNCTVGSNNAIFPVLGDYVIMMAGSKIIGNCHIGNRVVCSADSCVIDEDIPEDSIVFGRTPNLKIVKNKRRINDIITIFYRI